ncbi:MAG: internalization-related competence protein ComEC/Rec2 protein [Parcubacteria group bacterium GW2011_GWF2_39_8b]|uniref:ComEC/Rec2-related protein domain-containing protein n=2 Tax=Candidatus Zambryskiibacteriota TaxID=1817925 RepID=A0A1G2T751_9BACT|nr:MAG: internalization-related competence protein ComEC/Rec2 protein [Parcubacteria group bacterium GW2011_GWF2_39_8b]KKR46179.1 MAG: internalization-related competence protein ComEC/Rec2 protein [Parcubacteria group bacterium GW2011_GWA2_40_14]OHA93105.1 MAG: hypothetical protein A2W58_03460 [Candidatus Zambryskibacteria bacterium RIFCSPHIGHO2_02_38_10.5]OHA95675.1 MAG: hypothetical protein A3C63_00340 [Candidatus Zambryskibacteria bacterium RIFCSPHIGHO2_02_FULL_39_82]OHA98601.1 MAG: hypothet
MIISSIFGFISGIGVGSFFYINLGIFLALGFLIIIFFIYKNFVPEENRRVLVFISIFLLGTLCGLARVTFSNLYTTSQLGSFVEQKISTEGIIVGEPDVRENNTKLTVRLSQVNFLNSTTSVSEKILVTTSLYPEFHYGDKVAIVLTLKEPKNIDSGDGHVFDYKGYLKVRGIWYTASFVKISLISRGHGSLIKTGLFKIKHAFTASLNRVLPEPESSLMAGLLLGTKQSLGKDLLLEFQKTGVSHIIVLSGYNIAIVATSIMSFLSFLPKSFSFSFGIGSIILFTILSGGSASAWRAAIMVMAALVAKRYNRDYKASRVLGFAIVLMLAPNPLLLIFDPSFQLSVLATIGIIFVSPLIFPYFKWVTKKWEFREIISTTIATQLTVLPFLIYNTGLFSLVSLPVNILILATIPTTMFLGFITGIAGLISLYLSFIPAFFAYILLWYQLTVVHIGASLPFGSILLATFSPLVLIFTYLIIFLFLYFLKKQTI